jgi:hypothetical protein
MIISVRAFVPDRERRAAAFEEAPNWLTQHGELWLTQHGELKAKRSRSISQSVAAQ